MAVGDLTVANGVVKIVGGKLIKQYEESRLLHNRLNKGSGTKISDRGIEIPTHLDGNYNHKFMTDGGEFPVGGSNGVKRASVFFKNFAAACRLTGGAIDAINSGDVSYVKNWLQFNLKESLSAAYKLCNIYAHGTGSAKLATTSTAATGTSKTLTGNDLGRFLRKGMKVDFVIPASGVVSGSGAEITAISGSTLTVSSVASAASDIIVASGSFNLAPTGMKAMIDDGTNAPVTFQGLSRTTYPAYKAFRVNAGTAGLDVSHLRRLVGAGIHINAGELDRGALELWSHPAQTAAYSSLGWNLRRFSEKSKSIDLGFTTYEYEGIGWVEDVDCDKDRIEAIDFSTMEKYIAKDFGWDDKTGSILRQVPGTNAYKDQYEAYLTGRYNYGCTRPNMNGFIDGLTVPTGF